MLMCALRLRGWLRRCQLMKRRRICVYVWIMRRVTKRRCCGLAQSSMRTLLFSVTPVPDSRRRYLGSIWNTVLILIGIRASYFIPIRAIYSALKATLFFLLPTHCAATLRPRVLAFLVCGCALWSYHKPQYDLVSARSDQRSPLSCSKSEELLSCDAGML